MDKRHWALLSGFVALACVAVTLGVLEGKRLHEYELGSYAICNGERYGVGAGPWFTHRFWAHMEAGIIECEHISPGLHRAINEMTYAEKRDAYEKYSCMYGRIGDCK